MTSACLEQIAQHRVLPVLVADDPTISDALAQVLLSNSLPIIEVTYRTPAASKLVHALSQHPQLTVGAGTVLNAAQVDDAVGNGAKFVVSPGMSREVIARAAEHNILVIPGATNATDVQTALAAGVSTVKFFPAEASGGARMIRALAAPFSQVNFVPTGGINLGNLAQYLEIAQVLAVGGSWMFPPHLLAALSSPDLPTSQAATAELAQLLRQTVTEVSAHPRPGVIHHA